MTIEPVFLIEFGLVGGLVLTWAVYEWLKVRRELKQDRERDVSKPGHPEG